MSDIAEQVDTIRTREDLVAFLREFHKDYRENSGSWENQDLSSFLRALAAWAGDMEGYYLNRGESVPKTPEWRTFASLLIAAKMYE
jgi:hypothetical protein